MLWKLVITLFLVTNGVPAKKSSGDIERRELFQSEEACKGYFETANKKLEPLLKAKKLKPQFSCVQVEDNTI